jgi:hypothetical protein
MDRPREMIETIAARMPDGTGERIDEVLYGGEVRAVFVRRAVDNEIARRKAELRQGNRRPHLKAAST